MRKNITLAILVTLAVILAVSASADRPAYQNALAGVIANASTDAAKSGDPTVCRITAPVPVVPMGFLEKGKVIDPKVEVLGGDQMDLMVAEQALRARLQDWAGSFTIVPPGKHPEGAIVFSVGSVKISGKTTNVQTSYSSYGYSDADRRRLTNTNTSVTSSVITSECTLVANSTGGVVYTSEGQLAAESNVFSANAEQTARTMRDEFMSQYSGSSPRYGSSQYHKSGVSTSTFTGDSKYSMAISSIVTTNEAMDKAVRILLSEAQDCANLKYLRSLPPPPATPTTVAVMTATILRPQEAE